MAKDFVSPASTNRKIKLRAWVRFPHQGSWVTGTVSKIDAVSKTYQVVEVVEPKKNGKKLPRDFIISFEEADVKFVNKTLAKLKRWIEQIRNSD